MTMKYFFRIVSQIPPFLQEAAAGALRGNDSSLGSFLRSKLYRTRCMIDTHVFIKNRDNFSAGEGSALYHSCYILNTSGKFGIGRHSHLGAFCYVNVCLGSVVIGDDVAVGPGTKIIAYSNHYAKGKKVTEERKVGTVVIGNNVFIGANCTILPDTTIEDNVIVAAGSVVKGTLESDSIYGGIPCEKIKNGWYT